MAIRIFITGGTFDKEYNELNGELFFKDTHIPEMLKLGRSKVGIDTRILMMIDSLDMTEADRKIIAESCKKAQADRILVTHGTDTMVETAKIVAEAAKDKTVVFLGALIPFAFGSSDGLFNLGAAIGAVQVLPAGIYVCMNGKIFPHDKVKKNRTTGEFEEI